MRSLVPALVPATVPHKLGEACGVLDTGPAPAARPRGGSLKQRAQASGQCASVLIRQGERETHTAAPELLEAAPFHSDKVRVLGVVVVALAASRSHQETPGIFPNAVCLRAQEVPGAFQGVRVWLVLGVRV